MAKTTFLSAVFATYVVGMFWLASLPGDLPEHISQAATAHISN